MKFLSSITTAVLLKVKEQNVVVEEIDGSSIRLSSAVQEPFEVLKRAIKSFYQVYGVPIQWLLETMEQPGTDILEGVQAVICDLLYNAREVADISTLEHNQLACRI